MPTDLYGQSADSRRAARGLAAQYGVRLVAGSAESLGAAYKYGRKAGHGWRMPRSCRFNGNKIVTTSGGGMLVTKHKAWADEARFLALPGTRPPRPHYEHSTFGYNYRLSNICAGDRVGANGGAGRPALSAAAKSSRATEPRSPAPASPSCPSPKGCIRARWLTAPDDRPGRNRRHARGRPPDAA